MSCPPPDALTRFTEDALGADQRLAIEEHLDLCDDCRSTVALLARAAMAERRSSQATIETEQPDGLEATAMAPLTGTAFEGRPTQRSLRGPIRSPLATGTKVGRYVIGETLGIGGMGIVYTAHDPDLHRDVAIKILRPEFARAHADATRRIVREAQAMARVSHPNVVSVFDVGSIDDQVFVAMERVSGTSLRVWLAASQRTTAEILDVFTASGRGLIAAHDAGMVHRDFKPDNVLVGDDGRVRVTDFGLAYDQSGADDFEVGSETTTRPIAGTPAYMAPEQHVGGNVDPRTDQFSFAVALYEALYGQRPFAGMTRDELAETVKAGRISPPTAGSRVPTSLREILLRALAVVPGHRYATLSELLKALGRDRGRVPRQIARVAMISLIIVGVVAGADWIMRERTHAVTRTSFGAARGHLDKLVGLRTETFVAQADAIYRLPALEEVAASRDLVDFGLGDASDDRARLEHIHMNLRSADWIALIGDHRGDVLAIGDQKGRLLFDSADPEALGNNIAAVPAIAAAYGAKRDAYIGVIEGDDPQVVAAGLLGGIPQPGLYVVFARVKRIGNQPQALFIQLMKAARVLDDVGIGQDTRLSVMTPEGTAEGTVPDGVLTRATTDGIAELTDDRQDWLAERKPLHAIGQHDEIAQIVLARKIDVGISGLFPHARQTLAALTLALAALSIGGILVARRRNLTRSGASTR